MFSQHVGVTQLISSYSFMAVMHWCCVLISSDLPDIITTPVMVGATNLVHPVPRLFRSWWRFWLDLPQVLI